MHSLASFLGDESGSNAIEYSLIGALVSVGAITGYKAVGDALLQKFTWIAAQITN